MRSGNIALFVPHAGCPQQCSFCDQRSISGHQSVPTPQEVAAACEVALSQQSDRRLELAFFGGSFTAIDETLMLSLLSAAAPYLGGKIAGIRISTRPDCIDEAILRTLKAHGVTSIELGAQSMDDFVLAANNRGHTAADTVSSAALIKEWGFSLGLQMMTGLYQSSEEQDFFTAQELILCAPDTVRIYPTLTLQGTQLALLWQQGKYIPPTLEQAIEASARLLVLFENAAIPVIRMGLHAEQDLEQRLLAGPYHPAFRELCESRMMRKRLQAQLPAKVGSCTVRVRPQDISRMIGQKRSNLAYFAQRGYPIRVAPHEGCLPLWPQLFQRETEE